jgi:GntR family transcriptional regulator
MASRSKPPAAEPGRARDVAARGAELVDVVGHGAGADQGTRSRIVRDTVDRRLRDLIASGQLDDDGRLPTERDLAMQLGVSRTTIRQVLDNLERAGLVVRRRGRTGGTFVAQPRVNLDFGHLAGIPSYLRAQGFRAGAHVVSARLAPAEDATIHALGLSRDALVHDIVRVRLADEVRISIEHARFPVDLFPDLLANPLDDSMYDILASKYGRVATKAVEKLAAVRATGAQAEALGIGVGDPLMAIERVTYGADGTPLEHSSDLFRGDRTRVITWAYGPAAGGPGPTSA